MGLQHYLRLNDEDLGHFQDVYARYRLLHEDPGNCRPMIIARVSTPENTTWEERVADPLVMLKSELDHLRPQLEVKDDCVPTVRVQFGTAQVAAAFGAEIFIPENNVPAARTHPLHELADVHNWVTPPMEAGWFGRLREFTELWLENLPEGVHIQIPDIQSAFNSAHLIRGDAIFTDLYDDPGGVDALLDLVTDYMLELTPWLRAMITDDEEWFFDWGAMWKGRARISNCSMQMISPRLYREHVLERDSRFIRGVGGGRVHYCGLTRDVIDDFFAIPTLSGLDYDSTLHDLWELSQRAPERVALLHNAAMGGPDYNRLTSGDWPAKRNLIIITHAESVPQAKQALAKLRASVPD